MKTSMIALVAALTATPALAAEDADKNADTIIVTARSNADDPAVVAEARARLAETPGAVAVVAAETYENRLVIGMPDLLRDVPGVLSNKRYGEEARLSIRGSGIDQSYHQRGVMIAQDGVPFADADGFSDFQKVDALGARYIEVYKGGNAIRFGGAQLGGAVNLVTPNGKNVESENLLRLEAGSFDTYRGQVALGRQVRNFDFYGSVSGAQSDGYRINSGLKQVRGTVNIGYSFGEDREIRLIGYVADINQDVPGTLTIAQALTTPEAAGAGVVDNKWARDQNVQRVTLQTRYRFSDSLLFEGGIYTTWTDLHHPIAITIDQKIDTQGAFGRFSWDGQLAGHKADMFFGAYYRQGTNKQGLFVNMGGTNGFQFGKSSMDASGLDVFAEGRFWATETLAVVAGGSYGRATRDYSDLLNSGNDRTKNFNWFSPRFGLLWQNADGVQVYANVTRSVEPPHYLALLQQGINGFVPVDSQRAWTAEIGTRGKSGAFTWDATFYRSWVDGELLTFSANSGLPATFFNAGKTTHQGIEASLDWKIIDDAQTGMLRLRQTYAWSDFKFDGDPVYHNNRLPVVPEHQYRVSLRYEHPSGFFAEPFLDWRIKDTRVDYANTLNAPNYALVNLEAGWRLSNGITVFADARNLTGKKYVAEFGAVTDAAVAATDVFYPGEGRSVFVGATVRF
jgi:iron complex outermembrane receptor protein